MCSTQSHGRTGFASILHLSHFLSRTLPFRTPSVSLCLSLSLCLSAVKLELLIAVGGVLSLISLFLASLAKYYVYAYAALAAAACKFRNLLAFSCAGNEVEAAAKAEIAV